MVCVPVYIVGLFSGSRLELFLCVSGNESDRLILDIISEVFVVTLLV